MTDAQLPISGDDSPIDQSTHEVFGAALGDLVSVEPPTHDSELVFEVQAVHPDGFELRHHATPHDGDWAGDDLAGLFWDDDREELAFQRRFYEGLRDPEQFVPVEAWDILGPSESYHGIVVDVGGRLRETPGVESVTISDGAKLWAGAVQSRDLAADTVGTAAESVHRQVEVNTVLEGVTHMVVLGGVDPSDPGVSDVDLEFCQRLCDEVMSREPEWMSPEEVAFAENLYDRLAAARGKPEE